MILYRWYISKLGMSGVILARNDNEDEIKVEVENYVNDTFSDSNMTCNTMDITLWKIENDDDYNECYPNTIATNY